MNYPQTWLSLSLSFQLLEGWSVHVEVLSLTPGSQLFPGPTSHSVTCRSCQECGLGTPMQQLREPEDREESC